MFWTVIRWGGSAAIIVLVLAAVFLSSQSPKNAATDSVTPAGQVEATPAEPAPADSAPPNKNFNL